MLQNSIICFILLFNLLSGTQIVTAETSTSTKVSTTTTNSTTTVTTTKPGVVPVGGPGALSALAQSRITNLCANLSNRMDSAVGRLQNIINRLNSRLTKMSEAGTNVTEAKTSLSDAQAKLDLAKASLSNIDAGVASFVGSNNPTENWNDLKYRFLTIRDAIIASHTLIMQTIVKAQSAPAITNDSVSTTTSSSTN